MRSLRKAVLLLLNLASTVLTLLTGLRENALIVFVTGRYDHIRARLVEGNINYLLARGDLVNISGLPDLTVVGRDYRFISSPNRSPQNLGEDRSTCVRVNSMNASFYTIDFDDYMGKNPRRAQRFFYSISAPNCEVINFWPSWFESCVDKQFNSDADSCYQYIFDQFEQLMGNRLIQAGVEQDFGMPGKPFLKCLGRPFRKFQFMTDLMVQQEYWAGASYTIELQMSKCLAIPRIRDANWTYGLFEIVPPDHAATVVSAVSRDATFFALISLLYGIISVFLIVKGILTTFAQSRVVQYIPTSCRFAQHRWPLWYVFPSMTIEAMWPTDERFVLSFKGSMLMASDIWMNHWLYITFSILEATISGRVTYVVLEMGTWFLSKQINIENFIFMCSALTKMTWVMCLIHTLTRLMMKRLVKTARKLRLICETTRESIDFWVDGVALFMNYKIYSLLLCLILGIMLKTRGKTSYMNRVGLSTVLGGEPNIAQFWGNEIIGEFVVTYTILTVVGHAVGSLFLLTKYRYVVNNRLIRLMQDRYLFVGWDVFVAIEALGIDPFNPQLVHNGIAATNCSFGCVVQQLYASGPSGLVDLAGDYLFLDNGFSQDHARFRYPPRKAAAMGLCKIKLSRSEDQSGVKLLSSSLNGTGGVTPMTTSATQSVLLTQNKSLFDRRLRIHAESRFGRILLIDEDVSGRFQKSSASTMSEYVVQDALSLMTILDIKSLLGREKKLWIT